MSAATARETTRQVTVDVVRRVQHITRLLLHRLEAGLPPRAIPAEHVTHRDIVLKNATVELTDEQLDAVRDLQRRESESGIEAHA